MLASAASRGVQYISRWDPRYNHVPRCRTPMLAATDFLLNPLIAHFKYMAPEPFIVTCLSSSTPVSVGEGYSCCCCHHLLPLKTLSSAVGGESWYLLHAVKCVLTTAGQLTETLGLFGARGHAALAQYFVLSLFIALIFLRGPHICAGKMGEVMWCCTERSSHVHSHYPGDAFVFAVWPSHQSCVYLILTSALCRKRRWTGWSKQSELMLLEGTWAVCYARTAVSARAPPASLFSECGQWDSLRSVIKKRKLSKSVEVKYCIASPWCRMEASASHLGMFLLL